VVPKHRILQKEGFLAFSAEDNASELRRQIISGGFQFAGEEKDNPLDTMAGGGGGDERAQTADPSPA
jgi:hypothetical protein